jgi:hypothetical protein
VLRIPLFLVLPLFLVAFAPAAPVPKHLMKEPPVYFPLQKVTWKYSGELERLGLFFSRQEHITEIEELEDGSQITTVEAREICKLRVSSRGIVELARNGTTFDPPVVLLQLPARVGDSWTNTYNLRGSKFKEVRTFRGPERVKVPAGTFDTLRVDVTETTGGLSVPSTYWYAPHVGIVKMEISATTFELRSFTPAKE